MLIPQIHNLDTLRKIIRDLENENQLLKGILESNGIAYNDNLDKIYTAEPEEYDEDQGARILPLNPNLRMAKEFYSRFWGREDVYAKRGKNGGYFPQCKNRWDKSICPKETGERNFCDEDCLGRDWKPLDAKIILNHLLGSKADCTDVIGTYPLLPGDVCRFIVFDFDNHSKDSYKNDDANIDDEWKKEVDSLRKICELNDIAALVERSRSGRGAHVWILFSEPVSASLARAFGLALLDKGASEVNLTSFKFYDRMYPSQEVLSKLGNLVALPLQGQALKNGNSAFVDENWNAYNNQWEIIRNIRRISRTDIESLMQKWMHEKGVINLGLELATNNKPWKREERFYKEDVIGEALHLVLADGVYVDALNISPRLANSIRRMATIDNPEYYKNKRMGRSNYYNFRTIYLGQDLDGYIRLPRGLRENIINKCNSSDIKCELIDERQFGRPIRVEFKGMLKPEQQEAVDVLLKYTDGILSAATGYGKTVVSAYIIAKRKVNTLILIESADLMSQWGEELNKFLELDEKPPVYYTKTGREKVRDGVIGTLAGGHDKTTGIIDIAMVGSAYKKGEFFNRIEDYGLVIMDECHHAASSQASAVLNHLKAKYVYGVSATPNRSDKLDDINNMLLGPVRHEYTAKQQAENQGLKCYVYPRFTGVVNITGKELSIHDADELIMNHNGRIAQIVNDIKACVESGRTPLILVKLKKHVRILVEALEGIADFTFTIYGDQTPKENRQARQQMM